MRRSHVVVLFVWDRQTRTTHQCVYGWKMGLWRPRLIQPGRPKFRIYKPKAAIVGDVLQIRVSGVRRAALETAQAQAAERVADPISRETDVAVEGQEAEGELASRDAVRARGRKRGWRTAVKWEHPPREGGKRGAQKTAAAARRPSPNRKRQRARWAREEAAQQHRRRNCIGCRRLPMREERPRRRQSWSAKLQRVAEATRQAPAGRRLDKPRRGNSSEMYLLPLSQPRPDRGATAEGSASHTTPVAARRRVGKVAP
jgi:hypothetical protein